MSSKAIAAVKAFMPEWKRNLLATDPSDRCKSQEDLIKSISVLESVTEECSKGNFTITQPERFCKLFAGLLEMLALQVHEKAITEAYQGKLDILRDTEAEISDTEYLITVMYACDPTIILTKTNLPYVLAGLTSQLSHHIYLAYELLGVCFNTEVHDEKYKENASALRSVLRLKPWSRWQHRWKDFKAAGSDEYFKELGSSITIDILVDFIKVLDATECVCDVVLANTEAERESKVEVMQDAIGKWLEGYRQAPRSYLNTYLRCFITVARLSPAAFLATRPRADSLLARKTWKCKLLGIEIYMAGFEAAKGLEPRDPAQIAYFASNAAHQWGDVFGSVNAAQTRALIKEAKEAIAESKPWLPPTHYQASKFFMVYASDILNNRIKGQGLPVGKTTVCRFVAEGALESSCAFCSIPGSDKTLQLCGQCKKVYYCSKECQKKDWKMHKAVCKSLVSEAGEKE